MLPHQWNFTSCLNYLNNVLCTRIKEHAKINFFAKGWIIDILNETHPRRQIWGRQKGLREEKIGKGKVFWSS